MMILALVAAMIYGPWQLWVLASPTRTIRFRTVLSGITAGAIVTLPLAVAIEWSWTRLVRPHVNMFTLELVEWAGWTIDPFIEEVVRLLPIAVVFWAARRARQEWSMTDVVVLCTAVGSGFRLGEHIARHHDGLGFANGMTTDEGWIVGLPGFTAAVVEFPWVLATRWMSAGVVTNSPVVENELSTLNVIAIWSALGGLAFGLWTLVPRRFDSRRLVLSCRIVAVGLLLFAGLAHAWANASLIGREWPLSLLSIPRFAAPVYWAWPLIALGAAMVFDVVALRRTRAQSVPAVTSASIDIESSELWRLAIQRPSISIPAVWSFVTTRRAYRYAQATRSAGTNGSPDLGPSPEDQTLLATLAVMATGFRHHLANGGDLWDSALEQRRSLRQGRRHALLRSPIVIGYLIVVALTAVAPTLYLVVGGTVRFGWLKRWMTNDGGTWLTVATAVLALVVGIAALAFSARAWHRTPVVLSEARSRLGLTLSVQVFAVTSLALSLYLHYSGTPLGTPILSNFVHGLDALGSLLIGLGLVVLAGVAVVAAAPVVVAAAGVTVTAAGLVTAGTIGAGLVATGLALGSADTSSGPNLRVPSLDDLANTPIPPNPFTDLLGPVTIGAVILAIAAGWEVYDNVNATDSGSGSLPPQPVDPHQYVDSQGKVRWLGSNQLVSDFPNRPQYRDDNGVWRWADTNDPVDEAPDAPPTTTVPTSEPVGALPDSARRQIGAGTELGGLDPAPTSRLDAAVADLNNEHMVLTIDGQAHNLLLPAERVRHMLNRHHPRYFAADGAETMRTRNTSYDGSLTIPQLEEMIRTVIQHGEKEVDYTKVRLPDGSMTTIVDRWEFTYSIDGQAYEATIARNTYDGDVNHVLHFSPLEETP